MIIRAEISQDRESIHRVNELAFGQAGEADLVDALRQNAHPHISLVAVDGADIVGHIFFSSVTIESEAGSFTAMGLAPMGVLPEHQRKGIGSMLVG
jgi:putative acetyltransferase